MYTILKVLILTGIFLSSFTYRIAIASAPDRELKDYTPKEQLAYFAKQYGSSYEEMDKTIICESNWNPHDKGDHGLANGIAQFHKSTFDSWAKQMGKDLDYNSTKDQAELMSWAFSKGTSYKRAWTCFTKIYGKRT